MTNKLEKPAHKGMVESIEGTNAIINIEGELVSIPLKLINRPVAKGAIIYLSVLDTDTYEEHHARLSKSILNTIFGSKP